MRIAESQINMSSRYSFAAHKQESESLNVWNNTGQDVLMLSEESKQRGVQAQGLDESSSLSECDEMSLSAEDELKIKLLETFLQKLFHKKVKIRIPEIPTAEVHSAPSLKIFANSSGLQPGAASSGIGLSYSYAGSYQETESMAYSSQGIVRTSDGKEITFDLAINLSRSFASQETFSLQLGAAKVDPLVINLDVPSAGLSELKIRFDLDSDGTEEEIHFLSQGSGFLALDHNGDGKINNGSELFGPNSGNGFAELAEHDADGNNWIDEADAVFQKLSVWTKDEFGNDRLLAIAEAGIGAIYLGHIDTGFTYKDSSNASLAELAKTGIYLKESGVAGTVQHIDYFV